MSSPDVDPRVEQIAELISAGKTNTEIQKIMHIGPKTRTILNRIAQRTYVLPSPAERRGSKASLWWQAAENKQMMSQKYREAAKPDSQLAQTRRKNAFGQPRAKGPFAKN